MNRPPMNNTPLDMPIAETKEQVKAPEAMMLPIGSQQLKELTQILQKYKAGKARTEQRIIASENWWKLRNTSEEEKHTDVVKKSFASKSAWLHNVITNKHSDAMMAYPEGNVLPREESDKHEAKMLSSIIPCILEMNKFEATYNEVMWRKNKCGTGIYKAVWDKNKLNGLGDISIEAVSPLNVYTEPGVTDIQKSRYLFHTELCDKDILEERYPEQLKDRVKGNTFISSKYLYDDTTGDENKVTVIECYYHKMVQGKKVLHYVKYVNDIVLYATENDMQPQVDELGQEKPPMAITGLYDHGRYPYVFDALFPIEGSPYGYGHIDVNERTQTEIDMLKTSFVKNARVGAIPRYMSSTESGLNEDEFLDLEKAIVHVPNVREDALRPIEHKGIDGSYFNLLQWDVNELRETSGNTETATGTVSGSVTTASGIAALQEASGKGSKDSTLGTYRAFTDIVEICIELIRQFYNLPRKFRILGQYGAEEYVTYTNAGIKPQSQGNDFGQDMGMRLPTFDVRVSAQKKNTYTKLSQNELALQFFKLGFFNPQPQAVTQALLCLEMMDFDGKDGILQKVAQNGTIFQKLIQYMQMALMFAQSADPMLAQQIMQDMQALGGGAMPGMGGGAMPHLTQSSNIAGAPQNEHGIVRNARERSQNASQPDGGKVVSGGAR